MDPNTEPTKLGIVITLTVAAIVFVIKIVELIHDALPPHY